MKIDTQCRIVREFREASIVFLFLAPFLLSISTFEIYQGRQYGTSYFRYGAALVNALVLSKIIVLGQAVGIGRRYENGRLGISTLHKAAAFTLLYLAVEAVENIGHGLLHGPSVWEVIDTEIVRERGVLISKALFLFFTFIPLFAIWEIRRVLGEEKFRRLYFCGGRRNECDVVKDPDQPVYSAGE